MKNDSRKTNIGRPQMDADYALIEMISGVVEGDFIGPLQGISSRFKEIFETKIIGIFLFDIEFENFLELSYSLDRNAEKTILLHEIDFNSKLLVNNIKGILQKNKEFVIKNKRKMFTSKTLYSYSNKKLSKLFKILIGNTKYSDDLIEALNLQSCYLIPLLRENNDYISILFMYLDRKLSTEEQNLLNNYYLRQLDLVVKHIVDVKGLFIKATRDELTGLLIRQVGMTSLDQYLSLLKRNNLKSLSLIFLDIDNFKDVNDKYGHQVGDEVLSTIGKVIREAVRNSDIALRYGGEEICILLPDAALDTAASIAGRIKNQIKDSAIRVKNKNLSVTVSMGVAQYNKDNGYDAKSFVDLADRLMYTAKGAGRDKICYGNSIEQTTLI